jgi:hypothetical protein
VALQSLHCQWRSLIAIWFLQAARAASMFVVLRQQ